MPLYHFRCDICGSTRRRVITAKQAQEPQLCDPDAIHDTSKCPGIMLRTPKPPTANVVERLDNGLMSRAVERPADAERLYHERAHQKKDD